MQNKQFADSHHDSHRDERAVAAVKENPAASAILRLKPDLLTRKEAAEYIGVAESTLAVWKCTSRYDLPVVMVGRLPRYRKRDLDAWLESRTVGAVAA